MDYNYLESILIKVINKYYSHILLSIFAQLFLVGLVLLLLDVQLEGQQIQKLHFELVDLT